VVFVAELPEPAKYKAFWEDVKKAKDEDEENKEETKKEDEKEDELMQDSKFLYKDSFGETLADKYRPTMFIFDLEKN